MQGEVEEHRGKDQCHWIDVRQARGAVMCCNLALKKILSAQVSELLCMGMLVHQDA